MDAEAYLAYLRGRYFWNQRTEEGFRKAIQEFERALARDERFAPAWSGLADAHALMSNYGMAAPRDAMPRAREAAQKAIALEADLAEGHASLGLVLANFDWDFPGAERAFRRAFEKNPNYASAWLWFGLLLSRMGRDEEAQAAFERGLDADPLSSPLRAGLDNQDFYQRRFEASLRRARDMLALTPDQAFRALELARSEAGLGRYADAVRSMKRACDLRPGDPMLEAYLAYAQARTGEREEAESTLRRLQQEAERRHVPPYYLALVASGLGDHERALAFLEKAYEERHVGALSIKQDPEFDPLARRPALPGACCVGSASPEVVPQLEALPARRGGRPSGRPPRSQPALSCPWLPRSRAARAPARGSSPGGSSAGRRRSPSGPRRSGSCRTARASGAGSAATPPMCRPVRMALTNVSSCQLPIPVFSSGVRLKA